MKLHTSIMLKDNGQGAGQLSLYGVFEVIFFFRVNIWQNKWFRIFLRIRQIWAAIPEQLIGILLSLKLLYWGFRDQW